MTTPKRKAPAPSDSKVLTFTARNPPWTYLKLQLVHQPNTSLAIQSTPLDPLTARTHLTSALSQFLGLAGTSIPIDILKASPETAQPQPVEKIIWIRVPRQDAPAVVSAVSSWVGGGDQADSETGTGVVGSVAWRICAKGNFLQALVQGDGRGLFAV
ncbi:hypothetical protein BDW59DRAFT_172269 [Aspergillus cavernicola]|uniref:Ribonucleases P/MRP subunit Pop8-like domain-containing protein n=1 Tax=Aspergillus cavernicola TaxID=176166 RepID=A0ABR4ID31_9EURO